MILSQAFTSIEGVDHCNRDHSEGFPLFQMRVGSLEGN